MTGKDVSKPQITPLHELEYQVTSNGQARSVRSKIINHIIGGALVTVAVSLGVLLYWATAESNVLDIRNAPLPVRTIREHPTADGVAIVSIDVCKHTSVIGSVRTSFVSRTRELFLPVFDEKIATGCVKEEVPILIPSDIPADTYKIKFRVTYNLNPIKKNIVKEFESKKFFISQQAE